MPPVFTPMSDIRYRPRVVSPVPTTGNTLYRPHRLTRMPEPTEATNRPAIMGKSRTPDWMALTPFTSWRNRGRKVMAPNMAKPMTKPMALTALNTLLRKRASGRTGSTARRSAKRKATPDATPNTPRPMMKGEVHE